MKSELELKKYKACLVKQNYHIKGNLFIIKTNNQLIIYFYGQPYNFSDMTPDTSTCNKNSILKNNNVDDLCYGSLFKSPKKEFNKKIKISFNSIRLALKRIYYYRKSALEIFTQTKSYYFNLSDEDALNKIMNIFDYNFQNSFFSIKIKNNIIGYIKVNIKNIKENFKNLDISNTNFLDFISDKTSNGEFCDMCIIDIIILLNLISNRSYIDLHQYPIFPLIYYFDKRGRNIPRNFEEHIGFQAGSVESKKRKERFEELYKTELEEIDDTLIKDENADNILINEISYFNTHYSNIIYTTNYMARLFPYSFSYFELIGDGYENPNRLFFSIEKTFYDISSKQSDLRELIPEFFYLPEMFMNINCINFGMNSMDEKVDDVVIPKIYQYKKNMSNNLNENDNEITTEDKTKNNIFNEEESRASKGSENNFFSKINQKMIDKQDNENNIIGYFIFVYFMKNKLETLNKNLSYWINIIFGEKQRYRSINKGEEQYFKTESFIDIEKKTFEFKTRFNKNFYGIWSPSFTIYNE